MKKDIILSESDFKILENKAAKWDTYAKTNVHFIEIFGELNMYTNKYSRYSGYSSELRVSDLKPTLPEDFKLQLNEAVSHIENRLKTLLDHNENLSEENYRLQVLNAAIDAKLRIFNKIPNWIVNMFK